MKKISLAVAMLINSASATDLKHANKAISQALAQEYLKQVYAQVGYDYNPNNLSQTEEERRRRRTISREEYKDYHNIYPPSEGHVAQLRGEPWPCSAAEPCAEGEGTCFNPHETYEHPDLYCEDGLWCQERKGGSRFGPGEHVAGVTFDGALKMHHMGANDICFDPDWEEGHAVHRAVLRRKLVPCTHDNPCGPGQGDCGNDNENCNEGLHCHLRADEQVGPGEPTHGIEFTGDLLQNDGGANDICYNPHWPETNPDYEGLLVRTCDHSHNPVDEKVYLVLESERRLVPNWETYDALWPIRDLPICRPEDAFHDIPVTDPLCDDVPLVTSNNQDVYMMVRGKKRLISDECTYKHLQFTEKEHVVQQMPECALDAIPTGQVIQYGNCDGDDGPVEESDSDETKGGNTPAGLAPVWRRGDLGGNCVNENTCPEAHGDCHKDSHCDAGLRCCHREPEYKDVSNNASLRSFDDNSCPGIAIPHGWHEDVDLCFDPSKITGDMPENEEVAFRSRVGN